MDKIEHLSVQRILERGWTRSMVETLLGEPDKQSTNPYYKSAAPCRMYLLPRIEAAESSSQFSALLDKLKARRGGKDYTATFVRKYGTKLTALPDAADCLFNLNRYAKHSTCSSKHQSEIYNLKNQFIQWATEYGYLTGWNIHQIIQLRKYLIVIASRSMVKKDVRGVTLLEFIVDYRQEYLSL